MTDLETHSATSYGYINPIGEKPAFATPVFSTLHSNGLFTQLIGRYGKIIGFNELDEDDHQILKLDCEPISVSSGDDALWVYETEFDGPLVGTKSELCAPLKKELESVNGRNFLQLQIIQFIEPANDSEAVRKAFLKLKKSSPIGAIVWRDIEIILPHIRDFIWDLSEVKADLKDNLPLIEEVEFSNHKSNVLAIGLPNSLYQILAGDALSTLSSIVLKKAIPFDINFVTFHRIVSKKKPFEFLAHAARPSVRPSVAFIGVGQDGSNSVSNLTRYTRISPSAPRQGSHWDTIFNVRFSETSLENVFAATFNYERLHTQLKQTVLGLSDEPPETLRGLLAVIVFSPEIESSDLIGTFVSHLKSLGIRVIGLMLREPYDEKSYDWLSRRRKSTRNFDGLMLSHIWHSPSDKASSRRRDYSISRKIVTQLARFFKGIVHSEEEVGRIIEMIRPKLSVSIAAFAPFSNTLTFSLDEVVDQARSSEFALDLSENTLLFIETSKPNAEITGEILSAEYLLPELRRPIVYSGSKRGLRERIDVTAIFCQTPAQAPRDLDFKRFCYREILHSGWKTAPPVGVAYADFVATKFGVSVPIICIGRETKASKKLNFGKRRDTDLFPSVVLCAEPTSQDLRRRIRRHQSPILIVDRSMDFDQVLYAATDTALSVLSNMRPSQIVKSLEPYVRRAFDSENFDFLFKYKVEVLSTPLSLKVNSHIRGERIKLVGNFVGMQGHISLELNHSGFTASFLPDASVDDH